MNDLFTAEQIRLDPDESPAGYVAVLKASLPHDQGNLCQFCDWRPTCNLESTDFTAFGHRCMPSSVVTQEGQTVERKDGCSVVFKLRS